MDSIDLKQFIGQPLEKVKALFDAKGLTYITIKNSKPKIKTDSELVVCIKQDADKFTIIVGDFLINIEGNDGLV